MKKKLLPLFGDENTEQALLQCSVKHCSAYCSSFRECSKPMRVRITTMSGLANSPTIHQSMTFTATIFSSCTLIGLTFYANLMVYLDTGASHCEILKNQSIPILYWLFWATISGGKVIIGSSRLRCCQNGFDSGDRHNIITKEYILIVGYQLFRFKG